MKLIIVRHAETVQNTSGIIMGHTEGQLSENGIRQAKKLAKWLKNKKIDYIYCSDLKRTRDTLSEILKIIKAPVTYDPLLREKTNGVYDGGSSEEYYKVRDQNREKAKWRPKKGENFYDVKKRVKTFIQNLLKNHQDTDNILVITHGGWKNTFFSYLMDTPRKKAFYIKFANTSISEVEFDKNENHKIFKINCAEHLEKYE